MECISSLSYSLLINEEPNRLFQPLRGFCQGDPLSPYIFILRIEVFNSFLKEEANIASSEIGIKIYSKSLRIACLIFADDCILFYKTNH